MRRALELAARGRYSTSPNPMVGCVVVREGKVIGEGWHRKAGEPHAEVEALRSIDARGATLYATLEPCAHHGKTPPCADEIIAAEVTRVVIAMRDPHSVVDGRGIDRLRAAGLTVEVGLLESEATALNERFVWSVTQQRPFVLLKAAMTLDGKLATVARESKWITGEAARQKSLELREEYDAILVGSGTIAADDPQLTRRLGLNASATSWARIVIDADGEVSPRARVFDTEAKTILFSSQPPAGLPGNVEVIRAAAHDGRLDLEEILIALNESGIRSLIVEGGSLVHSDFILRRLWQKMIVFVAPSFVGGGAAPSLFSGPAVERLTDAHRFRFDRVERVGSDLMVTAYPLK